MSWFEKLPIHRRRKLRSRLHPKIVAKTDDINRVADSPEVLLHIGDMQLHQLVQKRVYAFWVRGHFVQKVIDPEDKLTDLNKITAKCPVDRPVAAFPKLLGRFCPYFQPLLVKSGRRRRDAKPAPHHLIQIVLQPLKSFVLIVMKRKTSLLKKEHAGLLDTDHLSLIAPDNPRVPLLFNFAESRYFTRCPVWQIPILPIVINLVIIVTDFNHIRADKIKHIIFNERKLLNKIVNIKFGRRQTQFLTQLNICLRDDTT